MKGLIEKITTQRSPEYGGTIVSIFINDNSLAIETYMKRQLLEEIIHAAAKKYIEDYGGELLKRIQDKTIDSKVIAKVVGNLRKELISEKK